MIRKKSLCVFTGRLSKLFGQAFFVLLLFSLAACGADTEEEDSLPLSITMIKDDFEVTLSIPKSVYYVKELRKEEDSIRSEVTMRYLGEEEEIVVAHNQTLFSSAIQKYDMEANFVLLQERGISTIQKGQSYTFPFEWEVYNKEYFEQGIYKIGTMLELRFVDPETEEDTGQDVEFALNVFPVELRKKKGKALSFEKYEAIWNPLPEEEFLTKKAETYAEELKEAEPEKEFLKVLAGREEDVVQYAVFCQENGLFSGVEIVTEAGKDFFTVAKDGKPQSLFMEEPPELSEDGRHLRFFTVTEETGEVCEYRAYVSIHENGVRGKERKINYVEVTGKLR